MQNTKVILSEKYNNLKLGQGNLNLFTSVKHEGPNVNFLTPHLTLRGSFSNGNVFLKSMVIDQYLGLIDLRTKIQDILTFLETPHLLYIIKLVGMLGSYLVIYSTLS